MPVVDPTREQVQALAALPDTGPVQMINLLAFAVPDGAATYARYAEAAGPHLEAAGARVVSTGAARAVVIGEDAAPWWDAILVVEYPSIAAFLGMVMSPEYQEITKLRTAALTRAELIATVPGTFAA